MSIGLTDCRHCGREIRYSSGRGWYHTGNQSAFCEYFSGKRTIAEPKR